MMRFLRELNTHLQIRADPLYRYLRVFVSGQESFTRKTRDIQLKHQQWYFGKSLDGYTPMGPCIVTADEIDNVHDLDITCYVNGEKRQSSNTGYMITTVEEAIAELSQGMTLSAGTMIATGTPGGVGMGMKPPVYLGSGDVVRCEIENIGVLENTVE